MKITTYLAELDVPLSGILFHVELEWDGPHEWCLVRNRDGSPAVTAELVDVAEAASEFEKPAQEIAALDSKGLVALMFAHDRDLLLWESREVLKAAQRAGR